ncbi:hypothetical protein [Rosenbergiella collisarenosi]|uniref:hypothetical protein n=1 Tax=Rosenbergiella collisarenosi TaxID=1544695 RepID=UPI001F4D43B8|nr:hypothetical protein [Rosenbergiella collisarenosi]
MLDEEFFYSQLGACVIYLSSQGEDVSLNNIRGLWENTSSLSVLESEFLLSELAALEIKTTDIGKDNVFTFKN